MVFSPHPLSSTVRRPRAAGFTLVELLSVIAIIGILSAMALGMMHGVQTKALVGKTQVQLAAISSALESYKLMYGDYPQTEDDPGNAKGTLCDALTGKLGPTMSPIGNGPTTWGKVLLDDTQFTFSNPDQLHLTAGGNEILDPWGNQIRYIYKAQQLTGAAWTNPGYMLYSAGPDGLSNDSLSGGSQPGGYINPNDPLNLDNIYAPHNP